METLDNILSRREPAPAQEEKQEEATQAEETATTEQQAETETGEQAAEGGKQPPIGAIRQAEREKSAKRYTEQVADFEKKLAEQNVAWERRFEQLIDKLGPKQEPKPAPDIFENPTGFVHHEMSKPMAEFREVMTANARIVAESKWGDDVVSEADQAFIAAYQSRKLDPADYNRVINSPNIYDAAVKWHKRIKAQEEIGPDPAAYKERLRTELKAEILSELEAQNGQQQTKPSVAPSNLAAARNVGNRSGPAWAGPKSLNDIFQR